VPTQKRQRLTSLDGLRGAAALVVLLHHALLALPNFAAPYFQADTPVGGIAAWLAYTPLHLAWAGTEAVYLFFVLSGFVLALATQSPKFTWRTYLPARLIRLYLPVIAAVLFGAFMIAVFPRGSQASAWLQPRATEYPWTAMLQDMTLLGGTARIVTPLWSLQWEVIFSLLLAAFLSWGRSVPPAVQIGAALVISTIGFQLNILSLAYLPVFLIGTALAQAWPGIHRKLADAQRPHWFWGGATVLGGLLSSSYWLLLPYVSSWRALYYATRPVIVIGVAVLMIVAALWGPAVRVLSSPVFQWAGMVSFSLYLIHEPIVIAFASVWPSSRAAQAAAIVVALAVAYLFYRSVEKPSHRLARALGAQRKPARSAHTA
jgi:peptidoglycan/LPS O-acetylase OafA/YrhL